MASIPRAWLCLALIAAGLIHLSLALGSAAGIGVLLALIGLVEFGFAVVVMAIGRVPAPRVVLGASLLPLAVWVIAVAVLRDTSTSSALLFVPLAISTILELLVAALAGLHLREQRAGRSPASTPSTRRYLLSVVIGALVIATATAPALAATQAERSPSAPGTFDDHDVH